MLIDEPLVGRKVRVEEAVARLFEAAREIGGGESPEVVVTVPPYFTDAQRRLLSQIVDLAGLQPLGAISDLTAGTGTLLTYTLPNSLLICGFRRARRLWLVAVDYASTRKFPVRCVLLINFRLTFDRSFDAD